MKYTFPRNIQKISGIYSLTLLPRIQIFSKTTVIYFDDRIIFITTQDEKFEIYEKIVTLKLEPLFNSSLSEDKYKALKLTLKETHKCMIPLSILGNKEDIEQSREIILFPITKHNEDMFYLKYFINTPIKLSIYMYVLASFFIVFNCYCFSLLFKSLNFLLIAKF